MEKAVCRLKQNIWLLVLSIFITAISTGQCDLCNKGFKSDEFHISYKVSQCPTDWHSNKFGCYLEVKEKKTWFEAHHFCRSKGSELASFHSNVESSALKWRYLSTNTVWIGLQDLDKDNRFEWSDGTAVDYTDWQTSEPNRWNDAEDCVTISYDRRWNDANCFLPHFFVCKIEITTQCGEGNWFYYNNSCYMFSTQVTTWNESRRNCMLKGADLAVIQTRRELDFILTQAFRYLHATGEWIGLSKLNSSATFMWIDGTVANNLPWNAGEPRENQTPSRDNCVCFDNFGNYNSVHCSTRQGYLCEKTQVIPFS